MIAQARLTRLALTVAAVGLLFAGCSTINDAKEKLDTTKEVLSIGQQASSCVEPLVGAAASLADTDFQDAVKKLSKDKLDRYNALAGEANTENIAITRDLRDFLQEAAQGKLSVEEAETIKVDVCDRSDAVLVKIDEIQALIEE